MTGLTSIKKVCSLKSPPALPSKSDSEFIKGYRFPQFHEPSTCCHVVILIFKNQNNDLKMMTLQVLYKLVSTVRTSQGLSFAQIW